jgi:hypothetical protein
MKKSLEKFNETVIRRINFIKNYIFFYITKYKLIIDININLYNKMEYEV